MAGEQQEEKNARWLALENAYVHDVYAQLAPHILRQANQPAWVRVTNFLSELEPGSMVCDAGCGNGQYLHSNPSVFMIGSDRCLELMQLTASYDPKSQLAIADALQLPFRDGVFDAALSIAVIHHLTTRERRVQALRQLARVVKVGGKLLITVWAMEHRHRKFMSQDILVPWHQPISTASSSDERTPSPEGENNDTTSDEDILLYHRHQTRRSRTNKDKKRCRSSRTWESSSSSSPDVTPSESCYNFVRRTFRRWSRSYSSTSAPGGRAWVMDPTSGNETDEDELPPIELCDLDDDSGFLSLPQEATPSRKSRSFSDVISSFPVPFLRSMKRGDSTQSGSSGSLTSSRETVTQGNVQGQTSQEPLQTLDEGAETLEEMVPRKVNQRSRLQRGSVSLDEKSEVVLTHFKPCHLSWSLPDLRKAHKYVSVGDFLRRSSEATSPEPSSPRIIKRDHHPAEDFRVCRSLSDENPSVARLIRTEMAGFTRVTRDDSLTSDVSVESEDSVASVIAVPAGHPLAARVPAHIRKVQPANCEHVQNTAVMRTPVTSCETTTSRVIAPVCRRLSAPVITVSAPMSSGRRRSLSASEDLRIAPSVENGDDVTPPTSFDDSRPLSKLRRRRSLSPCDRGQRSRVNELKRSESFKYEEMLKRRRSLPVTGTFTEGRLLSPRSPPHYSIMAPSAVDLAVMRKTSPPSPPISSRTSSPPQVPYNKTLVESEKQCDTNINCVEKHSDSPERCSPTTSPKLMGKLNELDRASTSSSESLNELLKLDTEGACSASGRRRRDSRKFQKINVSDIQCKLKEDDIVAEKSPTNGPSKLLEAAASLASMLESALTTAVEPERSTKSNSKYANSSIKQVIEHPPRETEPYVPPPDPLNDIRLQEDMLIRQLEMMGRKNADTMATICHQEPIPYPGPNSRIEEIFQEIQQRNDSASSFQLVSNDLVRKSSSYESPQVPTDLVRRNSTSSYQFQSQTPIHELVRRNSSSSISSQIPNDSMRRRNSSSVSQFSSQMPTDLVRRNSSSSQFPSQIPSDLVRRNSSSSYQPTSYQIASDLVRRSTCCGPQPAFQMSTVRKSAASNQPGFMVLQHQQTSMHSGRIGFEEIDSWISSCIDKHQNDLCRIDHQAGLDDSLDDRMRQYRKPNMSVFRFKEEREVAVVVPSEGYFVPGMLPVYASQAVVTTTASRYQWSGPFYGSGSNGHSSGSNGHPALDQCISSVCYSEQAWALAQRDWSQMDSNRAIDEEASSSSRSLTPEEDEAYISTLLENSFHEEDESSEVELLSAAKELDELVRQSSIKSMEDELDEEYEDDVHCSIISLPTVHEEDEEEEEESSMYSSLTLPSVDEDKGGSECSSESGSLRLVRGDHVANTMTDIAFNQSPTPDHPYWRSPRHKSPLGDITGDLDEQLNDTPFVVNHFGPEDPINCDYIQYEIRGNPSVEMESPKEIPDIFTRSDIKNNNHWSSEETDEIPIKESRIDSTSTPFEDEKESKAVSKEVDEVSMFQLFSDIAKFVEKVDDLVDESVIPVVSQNYSAFAENLIDESNSIVIENYKADDKLNAVLVEITDETDDDESPDKNETTNDYKVNGSLDEMLKFDEQVKPVLKDNNVKTSLVEKLKADEKVKDFSKDKVKVNLVDMLNSDENLDEVFLKVTKVKTADLVEKLKTDEKVKAVSKDKVNLVEMLNSDENLDEVFLKVNKVKTDNMVEMSRVDEKFKTVSKKDKVKEKLEENLKADEQLDEVFLKDNKVKENFVETFKADEKVKVKSKDKVKANLVERLKADEKVEAVLKDEIVSVIDEEVLVVVKDKKIEITDDEVIIEAVQEVVDLKELETGESEESSQESESSLKIKKEVIEVIELKDNLKKDIDIDEDIKESLSCSSILTDTLTIGRESTDPDRLSSDVSSTETDTLSIASLEKQQQLEDEEQLKENEQNEKDKKVEEKGNEEIIELVGEEEKKDQDISDNEDSWLNKTDDDSWNDSVRDGHGSVLVSSSSEESVESNSDVGTATLHRYYHVFREGELEELIDLHVDSLHVVGSYYDHANWCIVAEKVQVWKI